MIARIPSGRESQIKLGTGQPLTQALHLQPWPVPKLILVLEGRPRGDEGFHLHLGPEAESEVTGKWFGQQGDRKFLRRRPQEGRGDGEVTQTPEFDDQQFGFHAQLPALVGW